MLSGIQGRIDVEDSLAKEMLYTKLFLWELTTTNTGSLGRVDKAVKENNDCE